MQGDWLWGTTQIAENSPDKILNKLIKVRFDTNVSSNLAFNFKSIENFSDIKVGEVNNIKFRVTNEGNKSENVVSTFNTSPSSAGIHFKKISCFCFEKQIINPQETKRIYCRLLY